MRWSYRAQRWVGVLGAASLLAAACAPAAAPAPTAAPAKPTEAAKPAAPAASPAAAPAASPAAAASPLASPAAAAPAAAVGKPLAQPTKLVWGIPQTNPNNTLYAFYVAREMGFWKEDNLEPELVQIGGSGGVVQQIIGGKLDLGSPSMPAVLNGLGQDNPLKSIFTWTRGTIFYLNTLEDSGITKIEDLKGKNVGISEPSGGEVPFLKQAVALKGLDPDKDIKLIPIGEAGATAFDAVQTKKVDAYASNLSELLTLRSKGLKFRDLTPQEFLAYPVQSIIATPESLAKNREALVVAGRGTARATLFCQTSKEACEAVMRKAAPEHYANAEVARGTMDVQLEMTKIGPGNVWGAHSPKDMQDYIKLTLDTNPKFKVFEARDVLVDDLIAGMNAFDKEAVIKKAREYKP